MSALVLLRGRNRARVARKVQSRLSDVGLKLDLVLENAAESILFAEGANDPFAAQAASPHGYVFRTGMFSYGRQAGRPALDAFYRDFDPEKPELGDSIGQFCLFLKKNGQRVLLSDALGVDKIYHDEDFTILSNLFIGVVAGLTTPKIDVQGCYEYAWNGVTFGEKTFLKNVRTLPVGKATVFDDEDSAPEFRSLPTLGLREGAGFAGSDEDLVALHLDRLRDLTARYLAAFGDRINLSLSGGYDSRLLLALLVDAGVKPRIFTYGRASDRDCEIARRIAEGEGLEFEPVDKSTHPAIPVEAYPEHLTRNYGIFDGWKVTGLFDGGADAPDRAARVAGGWVKMNGSLGEIYRNFFYLPDRRYTPRDVVWSFFARYAPGWCSPAFDSEAYEGCLADEITRAIGVSNDRRLRRDEVELVYPLVRGRYWTAREMPINQGFGPCLFPFLEPALIKGTCDIPIALKNYGIFEGRLLRRINGRVAAYASIYGHSLAGEPPLSYRVRAQLSYRRPPRLRRISYRMRQTARQSRPYYLENAYLAATIDPAFPWMRRLFRIESLGDPEVFNRVATMEYVCQRLMSSRPAR